MNPQTSLAAWQLAVMAGVAIAALAVWLTAVFLAARDPDRHDQAAAGSAPGAAAAGTGSRHLAPAGEGEPERPSADQAAA